MFKGNFKLLLQFALITQKMQLTGFFIHKPQRSAPTLDNPKPATPSVPHTGKPRITRCRQCQNPSA
jgi:hypothetical protein